MRLEHISPRNRNSRRLLKVSTAAQVNLHPRTSEDKTKVERTRTHLRGWLDLRCVLPPRLGSRRRVLFSVGVGVGAAVSPHHVSVSFLFVELRRPPPFPAHRLTCPALQNPSDRSDTKGVWKDREKLPSTNNRYSGGKPPGRKWRLLGSCETQAINS